MDIQEILRLNIQGLKDKLTELGLSTTGRKQDLQNRLKDHFGLDNDESDSVYDDVSSRRNAFEEPRGGAFTLRDIEDSLTSFSGTDGIDVESWLEDFEDNAEAVGWNQLQKFIYAKQLLKGAARMFIRSRSGLKSWNALKEALVDEFGSKLAAIDIHRMLKNRKKKNNESYREYLYTLMEIGKPIQLDEDSLIQYFVDGIPDSKFGKSILYQSRNIESLKENIKTYEKIRGSFQQASTSKNASEPEKENQQKRKNNLDKKRKCYKCGESDHLANDCSLSTIRCFKCGKQGHKSFECKNKSQQNVKSEFSTSCMVKHFDDYDQNKNSMTNRNFKEIQINGRKFPAIIDTGSDVSIIRFYIFKQLGNLSFIEEERSFITAGNYRLITIGYFEALVSIDDADINVKFFIAKNFVYTAAIGNDILNQVDIKITSDGATLIPKLKGIDSDLQGDNLSEFCSTLCMEYEDKFDVSNVIRNMLTRLRNIIDGYCPRRLETSPIEMKIILSDEIPIYQRARRLSYEDQKIVVRQIEEWLHDGVIRPSTSEYSSPIVLVPKKDGSKRLCCDFRKLNEKILKDNFPMVLIDDVLHKLQSAKVYTTLDLRNGFFHVPVEENSKKYTSFVTHNGQYEFNFVPFGISNSPAVFSRYIFAIFRELIQNGTIIVYIDDIIIPSLNEEDGITKLMKVLNIAEKYNLKIKWEKCQFLQRRVNFLGYIIENGTIKPSSEKTSAVSKFTIPTNKKSLQRFLGLTSYFRGFIYNFAMIAKPLTDLLKKDADFEMKDIQIIAFNQLKASLISAPVLNLYNPKAPTEVHTDASIHGYGAVLLQKNSDDQQWHPVEYMSRKTSDAQKKYPSYELEVLAIIEALKKWRIYLMGNKIKIITDCNAFAMTIKKKEVPLRVSRWAMFLQEFDYVIEHRSGNKMRHVDALSRVSCLLVEDSLKHRLKEAQMQDKWTKAIRKIIERDNYEDFYLKHDLLFKDPVKELIVIPANMEEEIIQIAHREGHFGVKKTRDLIEKEFYIPDVMQKITKVVRTCMECILREAKAGKKEGLLSPIDKSDRPLRTYHIDHIGPMENTQKHYNHILVIVDAFTKFVWLYPTRGTGCEEVIDKLKKQSVIFGNPERIISDRGTAFTSNKFREYCEEQDIQHLLIATGVPRGNGQVERINKIVIDLLSKLSANDSSKWYKHVEKVQRCINNTPPRSTKVSPFKILTGCDMRINTQSDIRKLIEEFAIHELNEERDEIRRISKENIAELQAENQRTFNKKRVQAPTYDVNELVAIKRTQFGTGLKLKPKYFGPYKVMRKLNHDRYEVMKVGEVEGPRKTKTVAENMKRWNSSSGADDCAGRPNVGSGITTRSGNTY